MTISRYFIISRPALWIWITGPYLLGVGSISNFTPLSLTEFFFFLFPLNFFLYGINDIYDRKSDEINPRKGDLQGAILKENEVGLVKKLSVTIVLVFLLIAVSSQNWEHFLLALFFILMVFFYSHPWMRFKDIPFLDSIVGGPVVYLTPALMAHSLRGPILDLSPEIFLLALPFIGFHAVSTIVDAKYDQAAGMQSTGIFLGRRNALLFAVVLTTVPLITSILGKDKFLTALLGIFTAGIALLGFSKMKHDNGLILALTSTFVYAYIVGLAYYFLQANW